jgi:hypothetical protein
VGAAAVAARPWAERGRLRRREDGGLVLETVGAADPAATEAPPGPERLRQLSEGRRPFRSWVTLLLRVARDHQRHVG